MICPIRDTYSEYIKNSHSLPVKDNPTKKTGKRFEHFSKHIQKTYKHIKRRSQAFRKRKSNLQQNATSHPLGHSYNQKWWQGLLPACMWNFIYMLAEMKGAPSLGNNLAVKYGVTKEPRSFTPKYISKKKRNYMCT